MEEYLTTWRELIRDELDRQGEYWDQVIHCTLTEKELDTHFDADLGVREGKSFYAWTKSRVYFALEYDGAETVESVPRNPGIDEPYHIGRNDDTTRKI